MSGDTVNMLCRCGPRHAPSRTHVGDSASRKGAASDPTGTFPIRRAFSKDLDTRWVKLKRSLPAAVTAQLNPVNMVGGDAVRAFQSWIDAAMNHLVLGANGSWTLNYVRQAGDAALLRAAPLVGTPDTTPVVNDRIPTLQTLAVTELQGIMEAVSQQAVRTLAEGLLTKQPPNKIARLIQQVIDKAGVERGHLLISFITVRAFGTVTLDAFRASGITHVGTVAERTRPASSPRRPGLVRDAKKKKKAWAAPEDLVEVLTAGDDDVCLVCQDISDEGPYTLDEAERLIPAHPRCRCAFIPADDARFASVHDFNPDQPRGEHGMWSSLGGAQMKSWSPPQHGWQRVEGQTNVNEPPLPNLKQKPYSYTDKTGEKKTYQPPDKRLSSGVIMREPDGRVWLVKPTNGYGGYNYTFPKGGVERDLHPQANAIKETYEETGLKARITGYAGDYHGDTSITRMYHAERVGGHPKDKGWETEQVALVHPDDLHHMLNRSRDRKIAKHHIVGDAFVVDDFNPDEPRDKDGKWTSGGATAFSKTLTEGGIPHEIVHSTEEGVVVKVKNEHDLPSLEGTAKSHGDFKHKGTGIAGKYYTFESVKTEPTESDVGYGDKLEEDIGLAYKFKADLNKAGIPVDQHNDYPDKDVILVSSYHQAQADIHAAKYPDIKATQMPGAKMYEMPKQSPVVKSEPSSIDMQDLTKVSGKMGSNEGGVYEDKSKGETGDHPQYYIKKPATPDHVVNELLTAKLYQLAGANTLKYTPVKGGEHVATEMEKLTKNNVSQLNPAQRMAAQQDFAIHAWLANWDAAGTGGDNQGVRTNSDGSTSVVTLDTGGGLKYRAQGEPKGLSFGDKVFETDTLRNPSTNPDAANLYGDMTNEQLVASIKRVTSLSNQHISDVIYKNFDNEMSSDEKYNMLNKLVARKNDLAKQAISMSVSSAPKTILGPNTTVNPPPTPLVFKTKMEHAKHLLLKGTTSEELKKALNWPAIGVPKTASDLNLNLTKTKMPGGAFHYKGTPMTPEEIKAKGGKITVPITSVEYASAFDPGYAPPKHDIHTPIGNFKTALENSGVKYSSQETHSGHFITLSNPRDVTEVINIVKYHPQVEKLSAHEYYVNNPLTPVEGSAKHDINTPVGNFKQSLDENGIKHVEIEDFPTYHKIEILGGDAAIDKVKKIAKFHPLVAPTDENYNAWQVSKTGPVAPPALAPIFPPPTEAELTKAKKNTKLTAQYVPGAPADHPEAEKLIAAFNAKYEGNDDHLATHETLVAKVNAFKQLQVNMIPLMNAQQKIEAASKEKLMLIAAAKKASAAKTEADKIANLHNLPEEEQRLYWLNKTTSGDYVSSGASALAKHKDLQEAGVTPAEISFIKAFTGSFSGVNEDMRKGHMDETTFAFKHIMNAALDKMPKYKGDTVWRKIILSAAEQAEYVPGKIAHWKAFNSTSKNSDTWSGNTHFTIRNPKTGVDVQKISSNPTEAEVIMPADTYYKVLSKKQSGGNTHIEMEEVLPFGKQKKAA